MKSVFLRKNENIVNNIIDKTENMSYNKNNMQRAIFWLDALFIDFIC